MYPVSRGPNLIRDKPFYPGANNSAAYAQYQKNLSQVVGASRRVEPPVPAFPPGSVEGTVPATRKRRKKFSRDIGKVEAWRLMMALKSGLLSESHWALNVLNILLYDDSSAVYFALKTLPGLLEVLVEHLRRSLMEIFPEENFATLEKYCSPSVEPEGGLETSDTEFACNSLERKKSDMEPPPINGKILSAKRNFNRVTRTGRPIHVKTVCQPRWLNSDHGGGRAPNSETTLSGCVMSRSHWKEGGGLCTEHLRLKRWAGVEDSECLPFAKRSVVPEGGSGSPPAAGEAENGARKGGSRCGKCEFFYRSQLKEDAMAIGSDLKSDRVSALTEKSDYRRAMVGKCLAVSNILRGLAMIPGNETEMAKHSGLVLILGRLLLIHHEHLLADYKQLRKYFEEDRTKDGGTADPREKSAAADVSVGDSDSWLGECAATLREDAFVMVCQMSAHLDTASMEEPVSRPLLTALVHWVICGSPDAQDPLSPGVLSPVKYSLEALCKLSVNEKNVDMILATSPWPRTEKMLEVLGGMLSLGEELPGREFALVLVNAFCAGSHAACASASLNTPAVHHLVSFLEHADANMHQVVQTHGMQALRENPELMGTSVGMLRRAATVLQCLSKVPACRMKFFRHQQRLLQFTMSQLMDSRVAAIIADTLYELQKPTGPVFTLEDRGEEGEGEEEGKAKGGGEDKDTKCEAMDTN